MKNSISGIGDGVLLSGEYAGCHGSLGDTRAQRDPEDSFRQIKRFADIWVKKLN